jgi:hypothetical protein
MVLFAFEATILGERLKKYSEEDEPAQFRDIAKTGTVGIENPAVQVLFKNRFRGRTGGGAAPFYFAQRKQLPERITATKPSLLIL